MDEEALESWINEQLNSGYTEQEVENALLDEGISRNRIRNALPDSGSNPDVQDSVSQADVQDSVSQADVQDSVSQPDVQDSVSQPATLLPRVIAELLDNFIAGVIGTAIPIAVAAVIGLAGGGVSALLGGGVGSGIGGGIAGVIAVVLTLFALGFPLFGYKALLEARNGRTFGMRLVGIRVKSEDGGDVTGRQALIRSITLAVSAFTGYLATVIPILIGDTNKRIGDKLAGTQVVES